MYEVHTDDSSSYRRCRWELRGVRDEVLVSDPRKRPLFPVMVAVSINGIVDSMTCTVSAAYTSLDYTLFIHRLPPSMGKWSPEFPAADWEGQHALSVLIIDNAAIQYDEADGLALQYGILALCLPSYSADVAPVAAVFSILQQWIAAESSEDRLGGSGMPNGERMSKHVGLIAEVGLGSLTMAQCAIHFWRSGVVMTQMFWAMTAVRTGREKWKSKRSTEKRRGLITVEQTRNSWIESELFLFSFSGCVSISFFSACPHLLFFSSSLLSADVCGYWEQSSARMAVQ